VISELASPEHNHDLAESSAEKAVAAETRDDILMEVMEEAKTWAAHGPLSMVVSVLGEKYTVDGKKPDGTINDFANQLQPTASEKTLDTTKFVASLIEMRADGEARARVLCASPPAARARLAAPTHALAL
jgi:hypothetical protein